MSAALRMTRRELLISALVCLPGFAVGEGLSAIVFRHAPDWASVWHGFYGAMALALILSLTRGEQVQA